jgi:IclR family pca regulon transcriptional regulator
MISEKAIRKAMDDARNRGFYVSDQQWEPGICTVAVPVRNIDGNVIAGLNVLYPSGKYTTKELTQRFVPPLETAAFELGRTIAG